LHAKEKGLTLESLIEPDVPLNVNGDALRLRQIITNMIGNAIKFTEKGSVSLHVRKESEDGQQVSLHFLIRDTGIGIAADKLDEIFEPFTQADGSTSRKFGGTGLGLTITRQLAELMGGKVGVESVKGAGSTFWFTAVVEKNSGGVETSRDTVAKDVMNVRLPVKQDGTGIRLLLAEDDSVNQLVTKSILSRFGYQVDVADNGREALVLLEHNDYALVLMDCMMPEVTGYEATAVIRDQTSRVRNHAIPIIAMTAKAFKEDREMCLASGMDDYLAKPIVLTEMMATLEKWTLEGKGQRHGASGKEEMVLTSYQPETPVFDKVELSRRTLGDEELICGMATLFMESAPKQREALRSAWRAGETVTLRKAAHKLKGSAANCALSPLSKIAFRIESSAEAGDLDKAGLLLPELEQQIIQGIAAMQALLNSLRSGTNERSDC
jgi:CheY-like chemotaxis protein